MSFNNEEILTLAKAGFTAQQIAALNSVGNAAPAAEVTAPAAEPAPAPEPTPAPAPEPTPAPAPAAPQGATVDDVLKSVKDLTATMQNGFILGSQQPKPVTAEDILANIINPPSPDKKEV